MTLRGACASSNSGVFFQLPVNFFGLEEDIRSGSSDLAARFRGNREKEFSLRRHGGERRFTCLHADAAGIGYAFLILSVDPEDVAGVAAFDRRGIGNAGEFDLERVN